MKYLLSKNKFLLMHDWKKLRITSRYVNNRTQKLDSRNYAYFANSVLFSKLTSKLRAPFLSGKLKFSPASRHLIIFARRASCHKSEFRSLI